MRWVLVCSADFTMQGGHLRPNFNDMQMPGCSTSGMPTRIPSNSRSCVRPTLFRRARTEMGRRLAEVTLVIVYHCGSKQSFGVLTSGWPVQKRSRNPLNAFHIATQIQVRPLVFGEPAVNIGMYPSTLGRLGI
jgi:hypothetical protein